MISTQELTQEQLKQKLERIVGRSQCFEPYRLEEIINKYHTPVYKNFAHWSLFCQVLAKSKDIKRLSFDFNPSWFEPLHRETQWQNLCKAIATNSSITEVFFESGKIFDMELVWLKPFINALINSKSINSIAIMLVGDVALRTEERWKIFDQLANTKDILMHFYHCSYDYSNDNFFLKYMTESKFKRISSSEPLSSFFQANWELYLGIYKKSTLKEVSLDLQMTMELETSKLREFFKCLSDNTSITKIKLFDAFNQSIEDDKYIIICDYLKKDHLTSISLHQGTFINPQFFMKLCDAIASNSSLEEFSYLASSDDQEAEPLSYESFKYLMGTLSKTKITKFCLEDDFFTENNIASWSLLCAMIKNHTTLTCLKLKNTTTLEEESPPSWTDLLESVKGCQNLTSLTISGCSLGNMISEDWKNFCSILASLGHKLTFLDISGNHLGEILTKNNSVDEKQAAEILEVRTYEVFQAIRRKILETRFNELYQTLKSTKLLTDLNVSENGFSSEQYAQLKSIPIQNITSVTSAVVQSLMTATVVGKANNLSNSLVDKSNGHQDKKRKCDKADKADKGGVSPMILTSHEIEKKRTAEDDNAWRTGIRPALPVTLVTNICNFLEIDDKERTKQAQTKLNRALVTSVVKKRFEITQEKLKKI